MCVFFTVIPRAANTRLTLRNSMERLETITLGNNALMREDLSKLKTYIKKIIAVLGKKELRHTFGMGILLKGSWKL